MKYLQGLLASVIITCFLSACHSDYITKRRYNKGYYVEHNHRHHKQNKPSTTEQRAPIRLAKIAEEKVAPVKTAERAEPIKVLTAEEPQAAVATKAPASAKRHSSVLLSLKQPIRSIENITKRYADADAASEGLSLLWVLIIVILVIYIIGLILDLGGPGVHVLAIIALVLLILWLLRII